MPARLVKLQAAERTEHVDARRGHDPRDERPHLVHGRKESLVARVPSRRSGPIAMPEIDRKGSVRTIEKNEPGRSRDAEQLSEKCGAKMYPTSLLKPHLTRHRRRQRWFNAEMRKLQYTFSHMRDIA